MAGIAKIADIRGMVTLDSGEELLRDRDLISENGGYLTISEFVSIVLDDGRIIDIEGPITISLDDNFFQTGNYTPIETMINLDTFNSAEFQNVLNYITNSQQIEQSELQGNVNTEQLQTDYNLRNLENTNSAGVQSDEVIASEQSDDASVSVTEAPTEEVTEAPTDLKHGISNVQFYAVDKETGEMMEIKLDYSGKEIKDSSQPNELYEQINQELKDSGYENFEVVGHTTKGGGGKELELVNHGTIPDGATPEKWNDVDFEGTYNTTTSEMLLDILDITPIDTTASAPELNVLINETVKYTEVEPIMKEVIDEDKNTEQGIFENNSKYYQNIEDTVSNTSKNILNFGSKESISFDLGGDTNSLTLNVKLTGNENGNGQSQADGKIEFYNNGEKVGEAVLLNGSNNYGNDLSFDSFKVIHEGTTNGTGNDEKSNNNGSGSASKGVSAIHIDGFETTVINTIEVEPFTKEIVDTEAMQEMGAIQIGDSWVTTSYQYNVSVNASLTDTDGSETLSNVILNIGNESIEVTLDENGNGQYNFTSELRIPKDTISGSVTSTESNGGDTSTTTVFADENDGFDTLLLDTEGGINLDNIDISNTEHINLENNQEQTLSLQELNLEGVDNNQLFISGDEGDKVDTTGLRSYRGMEMVLWKNELIKNSL